MEECGFVNMWSYLTYRVIYTSNTSGKWIYGYSGSPFQPTKPLKKPSASAASVKVTVRLLTVTCVTITFPVAPSVVVVATL